MDEILSFLQAYKELDELCKRIFFPSGGRDAKGISAYIEEMEQKNGGAGETSKIETWQSDYKMLKHLRYVRNKLVHEPDSFNGALFTKEDIRALRDFRARVIARTDPLARLSKKKKAGRKSRPRSAAASTAKDGHKRRGNRRGLAAGMLLTVTAVLVFLLWWFLRGA